MVSLALAESGGLTIDQFRWGEVGAFALFGGCFIIVGLFWRKRTRVGHEGAGGNGCCLGSASRMWTGGRCIGASGCSCVSRLDEGRIPRLEPRGGSNSCCQHSSCVVWGGVRIGVGLLRVSRKGLL